MARPYSNLWVVDVALSSTRNVTDPLSHSLFFDTSKLAFGHMVGTSVYIYPLLTIVVAQCPSSNIQLRNIGHLFFISLATNLSVDSRMGTLVCTTQTVSKKNDEGYVDDME